MRTDRIGKNALLEELDRAREARDLLASNLAVRMTQIGALRQFADRVDHLVGIGKLMLRAGMPVQGDFVLEALDFALEDVCRATGAVRTPMREGMTAEELRAASASFLAAFSEASAQGVDVLEGVREREESLAEFSEELQDEKTRGVSD